VNTATGILSALRRLGIVIAIAIVFLFGLATTVYLSLRSPEVTVPDVVGKDRFEAERVLGDAGLNYRVRATRPSNQLKADTVLFQLPRAGEVVKAGQTVAMDISRTAKEGEASEAVIEKPADENAKPANANEASSANENKPKRNKNTNKNANENANGNGNGNRNANSNRPVNRNTNTSNVNSGTNLNSNRPALIINNNANRANENRRPPVAKPSPAKPKPEIP
jgi:beta-lactam-binding protein with PASTA domain